MWIAIREDVHCYIIAALIVDVNRPRTVSNLRDNLDFGTGEELRQSCRRRKSGCFWKLLERMACLRHRAQKVARFIEAIRTPNVALN